MYSTFRCVYREQGLGRLVEVEGICNWVVLLKVINSELAADPVYSKDLRSGLILRGSDLYNRNVTRIKERYGNKPIPATDARLIQLALCLCRGDASAKEINQAFEANGLRTKGLVTPNYWGGWFIRVPYDGGYVSQSLAWLETHVENRGTPSETRSERADDETTDH